jgi:hypothetical protein
MVQVQTKGETASSVAVAAAEAAAAFQEDESNASPLVEEEAPLNDIGITEHQQCPAAPRALGLL